MCCAVFTTVITLLAGRATLRTIYSSSLYPGRLHSNKAAFSLKIQMLCCAVLCCHHTFLILCAGCYHSGHHLQQQLVPRPLSWW
jgi:hypothetical protein